MIQRSARHPAAHDQDIQRIIASQIPETEIARAKRGFHSGVDAGS
jgi:hypothetical protein